MDVMMSETAVEPRVQGQSDEAVPDAVTDEQLVAMLVERARSEGLQLTGEGGLLQQLTKRVLESALEGEITDHLGYGKHDPAGRNSGNVDDLGDELRIGGQLEGVLQVRLEVEFAPDPPDGRLAQPGAPGHRGP